MQGCTRQPTTKAFRGPRVRALWRLEKRIRGVFQPRTRAKSMSFVYGKGEGPTARDPFDKEWWRNVSSRQAVVKQTGSL